MRPSLASEQIAHIQDEVGLWSFRNFGRQESRAVPGLVLGSLAPLMGIVEELGELEEAKTVHDQRDAVGDIGVYICDYSYREELDLHIGQATPNDVLTSRNVALIVVSKLYHTTLKHHQGIRGLDDEGVYRAQAIRLLHRLIAYMDHYSRKHFEETSFLDILQETWNQVKKRNWKKNKKQG